MAARLSAVDSVSPAIEAAKRQLFRPFRWGRWTRLALVTLLSGEMTGGGGFNFTWPQGTGRKSSEFLALANPGVEKLLAWLPVVLLVMVGVAAFILLWMYIGSVFRFILLDSVLYDRCEIRAGWRRWQPHLPPHS